MSPLVQKGLRLIAVGFLLGGGATLADYGHPILAVFIGYGIGQIEEAVWPSFKRG